MYLSCSVCNAFYYVLTSLHAPSCCSLGMVLMIPLPQMTSFSGCVPVALLCAYWGPRPYGYDVKRPKGKGSCQSFRPWTLHGCLSPTSNCQQIQPASSGDAETHTHRAHYTGCLVSRPSSDTNAQRQMSDLCNTDIILPSD